MGHVRHLEERGSQRKGHVGILITSHKLHVGLLCRKIIWSHVNRLQVYR